MTQALLQTLPEFAFEFGIALGTNLSLAAQALALGLPAGLVLGVLRAPVAQGTPARTGWRRLGAAAAGVVVTLLRAAPTFVVMYVLLQALPARWEMSPPRAVAVALSVYAAGYVADSLLAMLADRRAGVHGGTALFLMGLARAYFVMVLSSGFGAAIGVTEATAVTLRALEQLPTLDDRLWLMACVVAAFAAIRHAVYAAIGVAQRMLSRRLEI